MTGVRSPEFDSNDQTGELAPVQATPASKNGAISSGGNAVSNTPRPRAPKSGILNSTLAIPTRLPNNRSNCGQELPLSDPPRPPSQSDESKESYE